MPAGPVHSGGRTGAGQAVPAQAGAHVLLVHAAQGVQGPTGHWPSCNAERQRSGKPAPSGRATQAGRITELSSLQLLTLGPYLGTDALISPARMPCTPAGAVGAAAVPAGPRRRGGARGRLQLSFAAAARERVHGGRGRKGAAQEQPGQHGVLGLICQGERAACSGRVAVGAPIGC